MMRLSAMLEASDVERYLVDAPRKIFNAQRSAIRTTTTFADKEMKRRLAVATGLPASVFKVYRVRKQASDNRGVVWLGMKAVKAKFAGRIRQEDFGATAGRYYWQGGFLVSMNENHQSIFKREGEKRTMKRGRHIGKKRQPIVEQVVELPMADDIVGDVFDLTEAELQRRYLEKLEAALR